MYVRTIDVPVGLGSWLGEQPAPQINWCQMRQNIANVARAEEQNWTAPNGQKLLESHPGRLQALTNYWAAVPVSNPAASAVQSAVDNPNFPWSAAFICFVMRSAGVQPVHGFQFGSKHITYIVGALRNRENSDRNRPFWLLDQIEIQNEATPEPGDLICFNRCVPDPTQPPCDGQPGRRTTHSYTNLRNRFWPVTNQNQQATGSSHCALVVGTTLIGNQQFAETIGGNEQNSVRIRHVLLNQNGGIDNPQANHIFGMIKIIAC
ncbi:MAG TPA: DUF2272 domain-containing protein [Pyrinomonadaceae bacterium]|jgi:hypothetical protein